MALAPWTHKDISKAIRLRGWTLGRIAVELQMPPSTLSYNLRSGHSPQLRAFISDLIQVDERELWPHRFPPQWLEGDEPK